MNTTILTLNAGLFRVRMGKWNLLEPAPHAEERIAALPAAIFVSGADVVLLQEVCEQNHRKMLVDALKSSYPFILNGKGRHGLMMFSKRELRTPSFTPFKEGAWSENLFFTKGFLTAKVDTPGIGTVSIANVHLVAGGLGHPESKKVERIRSRQIAQVADHIQLISLGCTIIAGDFNAGPEASPLNYAELLQRGYTDAGNGIPQGEGVTWDPKNPLNANGPHKDCPPQRCDHVFTRGIHGTKESRTVFKDHIVPVNGTKVPISDHYGVLTTLA